MEIDERSKRLKLWVRRKRTGLKLICSRCGQHVPAGTIHEVCEREVRDLPCFEYTTTVVVETYRVKCPRCGIRAEKVAQLPSKAPYSKRFEEAVGQACESAAARQVSATDGPGRDHGASYRSALLGAVGGEPTETGPTADGRR
jgi:transposase